MPPKWDWKMINQPNISYPYESGVIDRSYIGHYVSKSMHDTPYIEYRHTTISG